MWLVLRNYDFPITDLAISKAKESLYSYQNVIACYNNTDTV